MRLSGCINSVIAGGVLSFVSAALVLADDEPYQIFFDAEESEPASLSESVQEIQEVVVPLAKPRVVKPSIHILYNGFISSPSGDHFFINGLRLRDTDSYKIVAVNAGGRSLELMTKSGKNLTIAIGQALELDSL